MLEELFVSKVRVGIFSLFLRNPEKSWHIREITRQVGTQINAVRRELKNLNRLGFLKREPRGNRVYFEVKKTFPLYEELAAMVFKEFGFGRKILDNLEKMGKVRWAFVSKNFFKGERSQHGAVDLFVIGDLNLGQLQTLISEEEKIRGQEINYTVMSDLEFKTRRKRNDPFLVRVLQGPRITLAGDEDKYLSKDEQRS
ncbi:MAG: winged helix-turn-helix domain-containing protein [Patescibacteria group bacterium]